MRDWDNYSFPPPIGRAKRIEFVHRSQYEWGVESSVIASELSTYFHETSLRECWRDFDDAIQRFLRAAARDRGREDEDFWYDLLRERFGPLRFEDPRVERARQRFVSGRLYEGGAGVTGRRQLLDATTLLFEEGEQIQDEVVESDASGFSHGFWIFG